ncbi:uncharacterized protein [Asterias amurensis]|uniref:uncharacterized protein n=1 Tax=Asterias amurensis TaxID=7602 RepID=UPI003AB23E87
MTGESPSVTSTAAPEENVDASVIPPTTRDYITTCESKPMNAGDALSPEKNHHRPDQLKKNASKRPQRASVVDYVNEDDLSLSAPPWTDRGKFYIGEKRDHDLEKYEDVNVEGEDGGASSFLEGEAEDEAICELVRNVIDRVTVDLINERANTLRAIECSSTEPCSTAKPNLDNTFAEKELPSKDSVKTFGYHEKEVEKTAKTSITDDLYEVDEEITFLEKEEEDEIGKLINSVLTRAESDVLSDRNEVPHCDSERFGEEVDSRLTSVERNVLGEVSTSSKDGSSKTDVIVEDMAEDETLVDGGDYDVIGDEEKLGLSRHMQNDRQIKAAKPEEKDMIPRRRVGDIIAAKTELEKNEASAHNTDEQKTQRTEAERHGENVHGGALDLLGGAAGSDEIAVDAEEEEELNSMIGFIIDSARSSLMKSLDISAASSEESTNVSNDKEIESIDEAEENETSSAETEHSLDPLRNIQSGATIEGNHNDVNGNGKASRNATLNDSDGDDPNEEQDVTVAILQPVVDDAKVECQSSLPVSNEEPSETDSNDKVSSVAKEVMDKIISILTSRTLSDDANVPPASVKVNESTDGHQSQMVSNTSPCKPTADSPQQNPTSSRHDKTASVIGQQEPLTAADIASDSDSDDDADAVTGSETKPSLFDENDWECLAIRQISRSQSTLVHYGDNYNSYYPSYNTSHLGVTDLLKKYKEDACDRVERKFDKMAAKRSKEDMRLSKSDSKIPHKGKRVNNSLPISQTENISTKPQHEVKITLPAMLPHPEPGPDREAVESGMALINDRLRKKIVALDQQIKNLVLNLTFLGDRNWRLEAYIDCLIKTLEVLEVTDVVDLDQKSLPLCLFRVKVKAGYKLSSFNGIPSRSLWSYAKDGRKPPFVDLSGWGDTDKPAENTLDPSFTPTPADDVGLSATQMYEYESQIEELSIQNQILEAQLREANERTEASVTGGDTAEIGLQSLHQQQQQHTDQPQYIQHDALQRQFLQQQLQQLQEYHHDQWREINQQLDQQQQIQQKKMEQQEVLTTVAPSNEPQQQEQQYSVSGVPQQPPPQQQQQQLPTHDQLQQQHQLQQQQLLQQHQPYQFQQYPPQMLQQQQQMQYQPSALQQTWLPKAVQDDSVISATGAWNPSGQHDLQDPQDWPTLTESHATVDAQTFSNSETATDRSSHSVPARRRPKPLASGAVSDITQPRVTSSPSEKSTLYSSLSLPASTGSLPNSEDSYKLPQDNKPKARAQSSSSTQSINRGRRFETNYRREPPRSSPSPHQNRFGTDTMPRAPNRQESFRQYDSWNSRYPSYSGHHDAANRHHHPGNWHPERPVYRNNWHGPTYNHQRNGHHQRVPNYDCTQRLLRAAESGLESVFGTDHVMFFKNQMQREEGFRSNDRDFENSGRHSSPQRTHEYNGSGNQGYPSHGRLYGRRPTTPTRRGDGAGNRWSPRPTSRPTTAMDEPRNE